MNEFYFAALKQDVQDIKAELKEIKEALKELQAAKVTAKKKGVQNETA